MVGVVGLKGLYWLTPGVGGVLSVMLSEFCLLWVVGFGDTDSGAGVCFAAASGFGFGVAGFCAAGGGKESFLGLEGAMVSWGSAGGGDFAF